MVLVGCAALTASCKQAPVAQMEAEYAGTKGITVGQSFVYYLFGYDSLAARILIFIRKFPVSLPGFVWRKNRQCVRASLIYY